MSHRHRKSAKGRTLARAIGNAGWMMHLPALDCLLAAHASRVTPRASLAQLYGYGYEDEDRARIVRLNNVAVLPIYGPLTARESYMTRWMGGTSYERIGRMLDKAVADPQVATIVMDVCSPGGESRGAFECADRIFAARKQKRIIAVANHIACSGGYLLLAAASEAVASPSADVGSVGVVRIVQTLAKYYADLGIQNEVLTQGERKADGNPYQPLSAEARAALMEHDKATFDMFTGALLRYRKPPNQALAANFGDGRIFPASVALSAGLVDRLASLDEVLRQLGATQATAPNSAPYSQIAAPTVAAPFVFVPTAHPTIPPGNPAMPITHNIRAALVARGLIAADANDGACHAALTAFYAGRGVTAPVTEPQIVADLAPAQAVPTSAPAAPTVQAPTVVTPLVTVPVTQPANVAAPAVATPANADPAAIQAQGILTERARQRDLRSKAALLNVPAAMVDAAIDAGTSVDAAVSGWVGAMGQAQPPVTRVAPGEATQDRIHAQGLEACCVRLGIAKPSNQENHFRGGRLMRIAAAFVQSAGLRVDLMDPEMIARAALRMNTEEIILVAGQPALSGALRPSDFPNLLSALTGKILDTSHEYSPTTFQQWAFQLDSVADFKPKTIGRLGELGELSYRVDGRKSEEVKPSEEQSWLSVDTYANHYSLTPVLVVNDDLGAFADGFRSLKIAHDMKINRLCVDLLTGNATAGDDVALFHSANHGNIVTGGGVPSAAQLQKHRALLRVMQGVSGKSYLNLTVNHILVPTALETDAENTLDPNRVAQAITDATLNNFKGKVGWSVEPMLDAASAAVWYAFSKMVKAIVYAYQQGYEGGRSRSWFQNETNSRVFELEGVFGANVNDWRGATRNPGS